MNDVVRAELRRLYEQHDHLSADLVLGAATSDASPLHDQFEWNNDVAGHKYRLGQARDLIRTVKIRRVETDRDLDVRAYLSVRSPQEPSHYVATEDIEDVLAQKLLLAQMRRDIDRLKTRYSHLQEFWQAMRAALLAGDAS